jgi:tetratricopeptide (TPR) repeat protein
MAQRTLVQFVICILLAAGSVVLPLYAQTSSEAAETHVGLGYEALKQDRYDTAEQEFRAALALDPSLVLRARFPLAVALFEAHKSNEARQEFQAVRAAVSEHPNISYYLGRLDIEDRNYASAISNLKRAIVKPPFPDTSYYLGFAYFKQGQLAPATKYLEQALKLNAQDARVSYQLGLVYRKQGRADEAKKMLAVSERIRQHANDRSRLRTECAQKLKEGPPESARPICDQLFDASDADSLTALGSLYGQHGMLPDALKAFRRASELAPHSPQTQYNLALTYYQLNDVEKAEQHLKAALRRWPDLFPLNSLYGTVLLKKGEDNSAVQALRRAHQLNPQDASTSDLLYQLLVRMAQKIPESAGPPESLKLWREASSIRPDEYVPHQNMAKIYSAMGETTQAAAERKEAERLLQQQTEIKRVQQ